MTNINEISEKSYAFMSSLGFRTCVSTVTHPFDYAKFLIQIGHEPMPSYPTKTLLGKPARALPNIFKYINFIKNTDGFTGCYRGFAPKITGQIISTLVSESITKKMPVIEGFNPNEDEVSNEERLLYFRQSLTKDLVGRSVTIVVSQPFYVISARMMAQFVGGEEVYTGIFASIKEIYKEGGISGFFSGLVPRWLGEIIALVLSSITIYTVNTYVIEDKELKSFAGASFQYLFYSLTYPFSVVGACMAVNNCGLAAGSPPQMPIYSSWIDCWRDLKSKGALSRGANNIIRLVPHQQMGKTS